MKYPRPRPPQFALQKKRGVSGIGLFTLEDIPKRRFVIEYFGKLVTDDEATELGGKYLFELGNGKTIYGTPKENLARYVNHSCKPNCEVEIVGNRVYVFSKQKIKAGEELNYDYGKEYFDYYIKPYGCHCNAHKKAPKKK